jgi:transposase
MPKDKKSKQPSISDMTPEQLKALDPDTLVALLLRIWEQNCQLSELLQQVLREKHGPKTERFENPDQLRIFSPESSEEQTVAEQSNRALSESDQPQIESESAPLPGTMRKRKKGHGRNPMPAHLERKRITGAEPSEHHLMCAKCSLMRAKIHEVLRNSRLEHVPASVIIEDFVALVFQCPGCGDSMTVEPPAQLAENGGAGPSLMTEVAVAKFEDHMPLNRQEQRFARVGVPIARSTMVGWLSTMANRLRPLYTRMRELLLQSKFIATDDTPVKVLDRNQRRRLAKCLKIKTGRIWIYRGDDEHPFNLFDYTEGRGRAGPMEFLFNFKGYLQGDCFSGNLALCAETGAIFVACLVHARRYFIKALPNNRAACEEILQKFSEIFEIERTARELGLSGNDIKLMREQETSPILNEIKTWLDTHAITALPKSSFGKGVHYCLNNWTELTNFMLDGDLRADNNLAEQEMKRIACGRKNWLFLGSDAGGETAEVLLSLISTCRRHNVNPSEYLKDILTTLAQNPDAPIDPLLPNNWKHRSATGEMERCHITPQIVCA